MLSLCLRLQWLHANTCFGPEGLPLFCRVPSRQPVASRLPSIRSHVSSSKSAMAPAAVRYCGLPCNNAATTATMLQRLPGHGGTLAS